MSTALPQLRTSRTIKRNSIEWCDYAVGSPFLFRHRVTGEVIPNLCVPASAGCVNCYAGAIAKRFYGVEYTRREMDQYECHIDWSVIESILKFRHKPGPSGTYKNGRARPFVFINDATDLFGDWVPVEHLDVIYAAFALRPDVDFLPLTKWPQRAAEYHADQRNGGMGSRWDGIMDFIHDHAPEEYAKEKDYPWPLPNVIHGASVENQEQADKRITHLLRVPGRHFISCEPLLGPLNRLPLDGIHWVISGGESGPGARPNDLAWHRSIRDQCKAAGVPFFMKQVGSFAWDSSIGDRGVPCAENRIRTKDSKGGDMAEWPEDLRVREVPG